MKNRPKRTLAESNPGWIARILRKLRTNRPAPTSATVAKATSAITSRLRVRREAAPAVSLRLPSLRTSFRLDRNTNNAGARPEINAAVTQARAVNPRMRPFKSRVVPNGNPMLGTSASSDPCIHNSIRMPTPAPAAASTSVSVSICVATRQRPAPRAKRIPNSRCRPTERASRRFATLKQTISSTTNETASRIASGARR